MIGEIAAAVSFISKFLRTKGLTSERQLQTFSQSLQELLAGETRGTQPSRAGPAIGASNTRSRARSGRGPGLSGCCLAAVHPRAARPGVSGGVGLRGAAGRVCWGGEEKDAQQRNSSFPEAGAFAGLLLGTTLGWGDTHKGTRGSRRPRCLLFFFLSTPAPLSSRPPATVADWAAEPGPGLVAAASGSWIDGQIDGRTGGRAVVSQRLHPLLLSPSSNLQVCPVNHRFCHPNIFLLKSPGPMPSLAPAGGSSLWA